MTRGMLSLPEEVRRWENPSPPGEAIVDNTKTGPSLSNQAVHDQKARTAQVLSSPKNIHAGIVDFSKKRRNSSQYDSVLLTAIRSNDVLLQRRRFLFHDPAKNKLYFPYHIITTLNYYY